MDPLSQQVITVGGIDLAIIAVYLVVVLVAGVLLTRMASEDIDSYFLGGHNMPWWLLGVSGTCAYFDVTGVMWTIAFFYIMGQRFFWIHWEWGFVAVVACFAAFMGKWLQRSRVVTGAEWMVIRFGDGAAGQCARSAYAVLAVVVAVAFAGFAEWGGGQFLHAFLPQYSPHMLAITLIVITAIYTILGGLYGVVVTDVIQFGLILIGSSILIIKAIGMSSYEALAKVVPPEWFNLQPVWHWEHLEHWEVSKGYSLLLLLSVVWVIKGMLLSVGGPQQLYDMQRFLAARSPARRRQGRHALGRGLDADVHGGSGCRRDRSGEMGRQSAPSRKTLSRGDRHDASRGAQRARAGRFAVGLHGELLGHGQRRRRLSGARWISATSSPKGLE